MRTFLMTIALLWTTAALAEEVKTKRYECGASDQEKTEIIEAPDEGTAMGLCRDLWDKARRAAQRAGSTPAAPRGGHKPFVFCKVID